MTRMSPELIGPLLRCCWYILYILSIVPGCVVMAQMAHQLSRTHAASPRLSQTGLKRVLHDLIRKLLLGVLFGQALELIQNEATLAVKV